VVQNINRPEECSKTGRERCPAVPVTNALQSLNGVNVVGHLNPGGFEPKYARPNGVHRQQNPGGCTPTWQNANAVPRPSPGVSVSKPGQCPSSVYPVFDLSAKAPECEGRSHAPGGPRLAMQKACSIGSLSRNFSPSMGYPLGLACDSVGAQKFRRTTES
jgi:hypothetical protein